MRASRSCSSTECSTTATVRSAAAISGRVSIGLQSWLKSLDMCMVWTSSYSTFPYSKDLRGFGPDKCRPAGNVISIAVLASQSARYILAETPAWDKSQELIAAQFFTAEADAHRRGRVRRAGRCEYARAQAIDEG